MTSTLFTSPECAIKYIATFNKQQNIYIEVGDANTYKKYFSQILSSGSFDITVDHKKYFGGSNNSIYVYIAANDEIVYCICFHGGGFKTIEKCMDTLFGFQNDIKKPQNDALVNFLAKEYTRIANFYNDPSNDQINIVKDKIEVVKQTMQDSISAAIGRGEQLHLLNDKAEALEDKVNAFDRTANDLKKKMCMENVKMFGIMTLIIAIVIILLALLVYGIYKTLIS